MSSSHARDLMRGQELLDRYERDEKHRRNTDESTTSVSTEPNEGNRSSELFDPPVTEDPLFGHIQTATYDWQSGSATYVYENGTTTQQYTPLAWSMRGPFSATDSAGPVAGTLKRASPTDYQTGAYLQQRLVSRVYQTNANSQPPSKRRRQPKPRHPERMQPRPPPSRDVRDLVAVKPEVDFSGSLHTAGAEETAPTKVKREYEG